MPHLLIIFVSMYYHKERLNKSKVNFVYVGNFDD